MPADSVTWLTRAITLLAGAVTEEVVSVLGVVFVHGVRSSAGMWNKFRSVMDSDQELMSVVSEPEPRFQYATGIWRPFWRPFRVIPSITTAADSLKEYLITEAGEYERLVLVGHSQGGLVIQRCLVRMLSEGRGQDVARIKRVVLLATPNTGSQLWLTARRALVRRNPQEGALRPFDELVADTLRIVHQDIIHAPAIATDRSCLIPFSVYAGESDGVVTRASAQAAFREVGVLPGDHFNIAKPDSLKHRTYATVRRLLLEAANGNGPDPPMDTVATLSAAQLEVHNADRATTPEPGQVPEPTPYLTRIHDEQLRAVLSQTLAGGPSRLIIMTGESSTGKTRALYEALRESEPDAPLVRPVDAKDLLRLLDAGWARPGYVLWLNEAQRFLQGPEGQEAAGALRAALSATAGIAAIGTLWNNPYWNALTSPSGTSISHDQSKALLMHPQLSVRIEVPSRLGAGDFDAWRNLASKSGDRRLWDALSAGAEDKNVVQHLSGGPELLAAYLSDSMGGSLFSAREHALITAALDARRLGHRRPLPAALLASAADGSLPARLRSPDPAWGDRTLQELARGVRDDGSRTDVRGSLTALTAVYTHSGSPAAYEPADYLEQHVQDRRADQYGTHALWCALKDHTVDPVDQDALARAAWDRGLRKIAVSLWYKAAASGHPTVGLAQLGQDLDPGGHAAAFCVAQADLYDLYTVADILGRLHATGAGEAEKVLVQRLSSEAELIHARGAAYLLKALSEAGHHHALTVSAERAAIDADLTDPGGVEMLLTTLRTNRIEKATAALLRRDPASCVDPIVPAGVEALLRAFLEAEAPQQARVLAERAAALTDLSYLGFVPSLVRTMWEVGAQTAAEALTERAIAELDISRTLDISRMAEMLWAREMLWAIEAWGRARDLVESAVPYYDRNDANAVLRLWEGLRSVGAFQTAEALGESAAAEINVTRTGGLAWLLRGLHESGAHQAVKVLAERAVAQADLRDPSAVSSLLTVLQDIECLQEASDLMGRDPAAHADLINPNAVAILLMTLHGYGDEGAVKTLMDRDPCGQADLSEFQSVASLLHVLKEIGAERAAIKLAERAASEAEPGGARTTAGLLSAMMLVEARHAARAFAERAAVLVDLSSPRGVGSLSWQIEKVGALKAVEVLRQRARDAGWQPADYSPYGREPDGSLSSPWTVTSIL